MAKTSKANVFKFKDSIIGGDVKSVSQIDKQFYNIIADVAHHAPKLETVDLTGMDGMLLPHMSSALKYCTNAKTLIMKDVKNLTSYLRNPSVQSDCAKMQNIKSVSFENIVTCIVGGGGSINYMGDVITFLKMFPNLRSINLSSPTNILDLAPTDPTSHALLLSFGKMLEGIEELSLQRAHFQPQFISRIFYEHVPKTLDLSKCYNISEGLFELLSCLRRRDVSVNLDSTHLDKHELNSKKLAEFLVANPLVAMSLEDNGLLEGKDIQLMSVVNFRREKATPYYIKFVEACVKVPALANLILEYAQYIDLKSVDNKQLESAAAAASSSSSNKMKWVVHKVPNATILDNEIADLEKKIVNNIGAQGPIEDISFTTLCQSDSRGRAGAAAAASSTSVEEFKDDNYDSSAAESESEQTSLTGGADQFTE